MRFVVCLPLTPNGSGCPSGSASWAPCPYTPLAFHLGSPPLSPAPQPPGRLCSCSGTQALSCPDVGAPTPLFPLAVPVTPSSSCTLIASLSFPLACELLRGRDCALRGPRLSKAQDDLVSIRFSGLVWCPSAPDCHRGHLLTHGILSSTPGPGSILPPPRRGRGGSPFPAFAQLTPARSQVSPPREAFFLSAAVSMALCPVHHCPQDVCDYGTSALTARGPEPGSVFVIISASLTHLQSSDVL